MNHDKISFINHIGKSIKTIDTPKNEAKPAQGEQLSSIVKYLNNLAIKENIKVRQLWLEKLPKELFVDNIKQKYSFKKENYILNAVIGVYDNPKLQEQGLLSLDLTRKGNTVIYSMLQTISNLMRHVSETGMIDGRQLQEIYEEHQKIYGLILAKDGEGAAEAMEEHMKRSKARYNYR